MTGTTQNLVIHFALVVVSAAILWLAPEILFEIKRVPGEVSVDEGTLHLFSRLALLCVAAYQTILFVRRCFRRQFNVAAFHLLMFALVAAALYGGDVLHSKLQALKTELLASRYRDCESKAIEYAQGVKFGVCDARSSNGLYSLIAFDSAGQVAKTRGKQSAEFRNLIQSVNVTPILSECDLTTTDLGRHLYYVATGC